MGLGREFRLPKDARPTRYDLRFDLDLQAWTFEAREAVEIDLTTPRRELYLHAVDLDVRSVRIRATDRALAARVEPDVEAEVIVLRLPEAIGPGRVTLECAFSGPIRADLRAIYRSTLGEQRFAVTQLAPADARRAFPCFDEPEFKARFALELVGPADADAIANGALVSTETLPGGRKRWRFAELPPVSSYLLAFAVGAWEATPPIETSTGVPCRVWVPRGLANQGTYARDAHRDSLEWLERYTDIPYPYVKMDGIGAPDFSAGAMENPAAIVYRLRLVAADPLRASTSALKQTFEVVSHEVTHMWWGDLATFQWWDDIWLNEAFATFVGHKVADGVHPDWRYWRDFLFIAIRGFDLDQLKTTHAIHSDAATVDEAWQRFDAISYQKGASVLRMIESYLGEDAFREGVRIYLRRHYEANATASDFWRALDEASHADVTRIASEWITLPGHPVVDCRLDGDALVLSQRRFYLDPEARSDEHWPIPLVLKVNSEDHRVLLDDRSARVPFPKDAWLFPNAHAAGFYRYAFDEPLFARMLPHVPSLEPEERLSLIDDQWALVRAGLRPVSRYLRVLEALGDESDRVVLTTAHERLRWIAEHALREEDAPAFRRLVSRLYAPQLERLGWEPRETDSEDERQLRSIAILTLGLVAEDEATQREARRRIEAHLDGRKADRDLVGALAHVAAARGDAALHARYVARCREVATTDVQEEQRFLFARAPFRDPKAIAANVAALLDGTVRDQEVSLWVVELMRVAEGRAAYLRAVSEHWDRFAGLEGSIRAGVLAGVAKCTEPELVSRAQAFLEARTEGDLRESAERDVETMRLNAAAARRVGEELSAALHDASPVGR